MEESLDKIKKNINDCIGLLEQLSINGQRNVLITYNIFGFLNDSIAHLQKLEKELEEKMETEKLNNEVPIKK